MPKRTGRPWQRLKARIIRRDAGICHLCGQPGANTADHITPYSAGGNDHPDNLAAAHVTCNRIRGNRSITWARTEIARRLALTTTTIDGWNW